MATKIWDVFFGTTWLGTVRASGKAEALRQAVKAFGRHYEGALTVSRRNDQAPEAY